MTKIIFLALAAFGGFGMFGATNGNVNIENISLLGRRLRFTTDVVNNFVAQTSHLIGQLFGCFFCFLAKSSRKNTFLIAAAFCATSFGIACGAYNFPYLITIRLLQGIFLQIATVALNVWFGELVVPKARRWLTAFYAVFYWIGALLQQLLQFFQLEKAKDWPAAYGANCGLFLLAFVVAFFIPESLEEVEKGQKASFDKKDLLNAVLIGATPALAVGVRYFGDFEVTLTTYINMDKVKVMAIQNAIIAGACFIGALFAGRISRRHQLLGTAVFTVCGYALILGSWREKDTKMRLVGHIMQVAGFGLGSFPLFFVLNQETFKAKNRAVYTSISHFTFGAIVLVRRVFEDFVYYKKTVTFNQHLKAYLVPMTFFAAISIWAIVSLKEHAPEPLQQFEHAPQKLATTRQTTEFNVSLALV